MVVPFDPSLRAGPNPIKCPKAYDKALTATFISMTVDVMPLCVTR